MKLTITGSIVLFKNDPIELIKTINCFLNIDFESRLFLIDNSPSNDLSNLVQDDRVEYIFNNNNVGFGAGHNIALRICQNISCFHLVLNPDITFVRGTVEKMILYIKANSEIGIMMPKILNYDNSIQYLPKLLPSPFILFLRKAPLPNKIKNLILDKYELRGVSNNKSFYSPIISGCFSLLNMSVLNDVGFYDDEYFMYFEDWDFSRRIYLKYKTYYYVDASVYHGYKSEANYNYRLFKIFLKSAIKYFNKWGWFFDNERRIINKEVLNQFITK
jgi:GT2 family glycosyltransferase